MERTSKSNEGDARILLRKNWPRRCYMQVTLACLIALDAKKSPCNDHRDSSCGSGSGGSRISAADICELAEFMNMLLVAVFDLFYSYPAACRHTISPSQNAHTKQFAIR